MKSLFGLYATVLRAKSLHQLWASFPHNTWKKSLANFEPKTPEPRNEIFFSQKYRYIIFCAPTLQTIVLLLARFQNFAGTLVVQSTVNVHVWDNTVTYIV